MGSRHSAVHILACWVGSCRRKKFRNLSERYANAYAYMQTTYVGKKSASPAPPISMLCKIRVGLVAKFIPEERKSLHAPRRGPTLKYGVRGVPPGEAFLSDVLVEVAKFLQSAETLETCRISGFRKSPHNFKKIIIKKN